MEKQVIKLKVNENSPEAIMEVYLWESSMEMWTNKKRPMVIVCPGGSYRFISDREGDPIALEFLCAGCNTAVLKYTVPALFPTGLAQLSKAVSEIRKHADEWMVNTDKIIVQGSSAGGHLAASLGVFWQEGFLTELLKEDKQMRKPNGLILDYPVITTGTCGHRESFDYLLGEHYEEMKEKVSLENQVTKQVPPTFIWTTYSDDLVDVENSVLFVRSLVQAHVSTEFHMYEAGVHGLALANRITAFNDGGGIQKECENWIELAKNWICHRYIE